jgi:hypothetical protein
MNTQHPPLADPRLEFVHRPSMGFGRTQTPKSIPVGGEPGAFQRCGTCRAHTVRAPDSPLLISAIQNQVAHPPHAG